MEDGIYTNSIAAFDFDLLVQPLNYKFDSRSYKKSEDLDFDPNESKHPEHILHHFPHYPEVKIHFSRYVELIVVLPC